jgi:hypothetical protein
MNDPANVRTPSEQAEHEALSQKLIGTVFPQPTLAEARLDMMATSPIGTIASLAAGAAGGSQQAQDWAFIAGRHRRHLRAGPRFADRGAAVGYRKCRSIIRPTTNQAGGGYA